MSLLRLGIFLDGGKSLYDKYFPTEEADKDQLLLFAYLFGYDCVDQNDERY